MGWVIGIGNGVVFRQGGGGSWQSYWTPSSAVVENAAPTDIVLTYTNKVNPADAVTTNFTVAGKTISGAVLDGTGKILTLTVTVAFVYGDSITVVANSENIAVTNNISAESELTTYITGLTTPLSSAQLVRINTLIKALKTGLSITNLSDAFDCMYILAGETAESSLKNLVKNLHHATNVNACTHTQYEGYKGNATDNYIDYNYNPTSHADNYSLNNASFGVYIRTGWSSGTNGLEIGSDLSTGLRVTSPSSNKGRAGINSADVLTITAGNFSNIIKASFFIIRRADNTNIVINRAKTLISPDSAEASADLPNADFESFGGFSGIGYSDSQQSFVFIGRAFSEANEGIIIDAVEAYMDANGKGIL